MNAQQALEYYRQPFIPMFIYGDYDAMESERQRGEEALKALVDEWRANDEPGFDFDVILDLADRNRELCDQIGEARLRNLSSPLLARNLSDADLCAAIGKMQGRAASAVAREVRGDRDAYSVAYVRKPIKGTVLHDTRPPGARRNAAISSTWAGRSWSSPATPSRTTRRPSTAVSPTCTERPACRWPISTTSSGATLRARRPSAWIPSCKKSC